MAKLRLYAAPITLALWAVVWTLGVRGDAVVIVGLAWTSVATLESITQSIRRPREHRDRG
jgi:hypothetical protein